MVTESNFAESVGFQPESVIWQNHVIFLCTMLVPKKKCITIWYSNIAWKIRRKKWDFAPGFPSGTNEPGSTITPTPRALLQVHRPEKKKIKIPSHWPFRINQFLNGQCGGFSFFSFVRSGGLQECLAVSIGVKLPHNWCTSTAPYTGVCSVYSVL